MKTDIYWVKYRLQMLIDHLQDKADFWFRAYDNSKYPLSRFLLRAKRYQNRVRGLVMAYDLIINLESEVYD